MIKWKTTYYHLGSEKDLERIGIFLKGGNDR